LEIYESTFGPDSLPTAYALNTLGGLYHLDRRYFEAEPLFKRALAIREKALGSDHHDVAIVLNNLALLYRAQGRYADALRAINQTILASRIDKVVAFPVLFDSQGQGLITPLHAMTDSYAILQLSWSSSAADAVSRLAARFAAGSDALAQLVRKDQDLLAERDALDRNLIVAVGKQISQRNSAVEDQFRNRIEAIKSEREALQKSFAERFPNYVALSKPQPLSLEDTRALLSDDEALVAFDFDKKSYAWVITRADADWVELKITAKELEEQVKALRSSLSFDIDNKPFDTQLAFKIYQETFGTIADKLQGKTRLSVVTNGALTSLPFQLLVTKDPGNKQLKDIDWLVRSYAITNLPSVASLKTLRSTASSSSAAKPMIGFADPIFSKDGSKQVAALRSVVNFYEGGRPDLSSLAKALQQLPETANEVRAIGEVLKADRNDLKLGIFASEATVKQTKLDDYRIVYFATHGLVAGEVEKFAKVKAEPALALTIPDKPTDLDDGLLTASEVAQLKLNAEWVILSACNTAAESNPGAEALSGLARAFFYAGARSLVVSHWEVDSDASVKLMTKMFQTMATDPKLSHAEALRQSMLAMVASAGSDHDAHPRLWAPFVVVGEPAKPH
jgi:CHAT domain-containing protein